ncbi:MAG: DUF1761 family protein [Bacteroidetes bacterium]|nr:DUF1761 family protein [Bacteroidota bacterium]
MNTSKILIASIIGAVVNFLVGWVIYGMILMDTMNNSTTPEAKAVTKTEPNLLGVFVSGLLFSIMYAYVFEKMGNVRTFVSGAITGGIIGLLITAGLDVQFWSMFTMYTSTTPLLLDIVGGTIMSAIVGGAIGWYLGFQRKD